MNIEVKSIEFETNAEACEHINYPTSGLFILKQEGFSDLRLIDKSVKNNYCICPESIFNSVVKAIKADIATVMPKENKFDGDFILEFSRILLNRK